LKVPQCFGFDRRPVDWGRLARGSGDGGAQKHEDKPSRGETLAELLSQRAPSSSGLPPEEAIGIARRVALEARTRTHDHLRAELFDELHRRVPVSW
jgi:hypothetical protein